MAKLKDTIKPPDYLKERFYQQVILTLTDGTTATYIGPVQLTEGAAVSGVKVIGPIPMQPDWSFAEVGTLRPVKDTPKGES